jgi:hypothetical protein
VTRAVLALAALVACHREASAPPNPDTFSGTLSLDGAPLALLACRPAHAVHVYVVVTTSRGELRFEDQQLYWNQQPLTCAKLDRSWGGGNRADGTSYWRGMLDVDCTGPSGHLAGRLDLDCGHITPAERAELDKNRREHPQR